MIGGAMTTASLAGVRLRDDVHDQLTTFSGYVALGATYRQAGREFARAPRSAHCSRPSTRRRARDW